MSLVGRNVVIVTIMVARATTTLSVERRDEALALIESRAADAVCFTPQGEGRVLAATTDYLLVTEVALDAIDPDLIQRVRHPVGAEDPRIAMLDLQWRLSLHGLTVLALDGPVTTLAAGEAQHRSRQALQALAVLTGDDVQGPLMSAAQAYLDCDDPVAASSARELVQSGRRVPDRFLTALMEPAVAHLVGAESTAERARLGELLDAHGVRPVLLEPLHVLVVVPETGPPRERAEALVGVLGEAVTVRLGASGGGVVLEDAIPATMSRSDQQPWADVLVLIAATFDDVGGELIPEVPVVIDFTTLDLVAWLVDEPPSGNRPAALARMLARADLVLAADQGQRDILLGALAGQVRVNAAVYDHDPSLLSLVRTDKDGLALAEFCRRPVRAADTNLPPFVVPAKMGTMALAAMHLRQGGPRMLAQKVGGRITRAYRQHVARTR